jgi:CBS domain-containing protein
MEDQVITAKPNSTIREAANLMRGRTIGSLPVVDDKDQLVGIITTTDLLTLLGQGIERIMPDTQKRVATREPGRRPPGIRRV